MVRETCNSDIILTAIDLCEGENFCSFDSILFITFIEITLTEQEERIMMLLL